MAAAWQNADGLQVPFGNFWNDPKNFVNRARATDTTGAVKEIVFDYDLVRIANGAVTYTADLNNDGTLDGFHTGNIYLPANSNVVEAFLYVTEAAAGGTSIKLGTFTLTGTEIDDDFILNTTDGAKAKIDTKGAIIRCRGVGLVDLAIDGDGAVTTVEKAGVGNADAYLAMTGSGTWTAGKGRIVIRYIDTVGDAA